MEHLRDETRTNPETVKMKTDRQQKAINPLGNKATDVLEESKENLHSGIYVLPGQIITLK